VKAIRTINVFTGKEKEHSENALQLLYDNGPLSAWELAEKLSYVGRRKRAMYREKIRSGIYSSKE
jgi:hypothetical protein